MGTKGYAHTSRQSLPFFAGAEAKVKKNAGIREIKNRERLGQGNAGDGAGGKGKGGGGRWRGEV